MVGEQVMWDKPQGTREVPGHHFAVENGKLKISDE